MWERGGNASIIEICENGIEISEDSERSTEISVGIFVIKSLLQLFDISYSHVPCRLGC